MAHYQRITAASPAEALRLAEEVLTARIPIEKAAEDMNCITLWGGFGRVTFYVLRQGLDTTVTATTDQLRTSRLDLETQYYLNKLPYQPGDRPTR
jgi:hypothetical protein